MGLTDHIREELAVRDETSLLEELIALATRLYNRLRERQRERHDSLYTPPAAVGHGSTGWTIARTKPMSRLLPPLPPLKWDSEPMQVGRMRLSSAERRRRTRNNLCLYCGKGGHFLLLIVPGQFPGLQHSEFFVFIDSGSDSDSDSEYFIDPRGEILFIPNAPCKVEMETSDKDE